MITRRSALGLLPAGMLGARAAIAPAAARDTTSSLEPDDAEARRVPNELAERARALPALISLGVPDADVVFVEFFDYNCPVCRATAADVAPLVSEYRVGWLLANYPILSSASREAAQIALGYLAANGPEAYGRLHAALFAGRGVIDGARVLAVAESLGADLDALGRAAALPGVTPAVEDILEVGRMMGLDTTPATLVGPWAFDGYLSLAHKSRIVGDLRA